MSVFPRIPGYQLRARLGAGGMGVVYFATRNDNDYKYAIKMLLVGRDASLEALARFRIEAEAYACLNHPYIVKIRDVGVVLGCPFLAMDYAENGSLGDYIARSPLLDMSWRVKTVKDVADALSHAHGRHILHRDLKPANILIAADGSPRISDFGLVKFSAPLSAVSQSCCTLQVSALDEHLLQMVNENKHFLPAEDAGDLVETLAMKCADRSGLATESFDVEGVRTFIKRSMDSRKFSGESLPMLDDVTRHGSVMGSPQFMSPEQAEGRLDNIGPHTDVYGLGATLYHVVTGTTPVSGSNAWEMVRNVSTQQPVPPNAINSCVSEDLSCVIMKALDKDAGCRYATMEMFSEDLGRILEGHTPLARLHARPMSSQNRRHSFFHRIASSLSTLIPARKHRTEDPLTTRGPYGTEQCDARGAADNAVSDGKSLPAAR